MLALPLELIRQVIENIVDDIEDSPYRCDLSAVSLSCRLFRHEAQRVLFSDSGELHTTTAARGKTIMFMDTVVSSPGRLALYVKTFSITFDDWFHHTSDHTTSFVQKLSKALQAMRNLKALDVFQWTSSVRFLPCILQHVHSKLTSFCWFGCLDTIAEPESDIIDFLRAQNNIEHLALSSLADENTLRAAAPDICPRLRSLSAPYQMTEILLPGKLHITSMQWSPAHSYHATYAQDDLDADIPANLERISSELRKIRYLSYDVTGSISPAGPNIRRLAPYLSNLICLNSHRSCVKQADVLSQLPRLKYLILQQGAYDTWPNEDDLMKVAISCKTLNHIDIEEDSGAFVRFTYDHVSEGLQSLSIGESDTYMWFDDFDVFDD